MQPVALDLRLIEQLRDNWADYKTQREFHKMTEYLEKYHSIPIDNQGGVSEWLTGFRKMLDSIQDQNLRKMFDDLLGPRNMKFTPVMLSQVSDLLKNLAETTPDKIGVQSKSKTEEAIRYYNLIDFNSQEYDTRCRLYRIPKTITFKPGKEFSPAEILAPYIREAKQIEFCDLFLFKNPKFDDDAEFILSVLRLCSKPAEILLHGEPNELNLLQKKTENTIKSLYGDKVYKGVKKYNPPTKDDNHDRFIILDRNKISIRFSSSFNNLRKVAVKENIFKVKDSFIMEFSHGRKYYD